MKLVLGDESVNYKKGTNDKFCPLLETSPIDIKNDKLDYSRIIFRTNQTISNENQKKEYLIRNIDSFYAKYILGTNGSYYNVFANHTPIGVNQNEQITGISSLRYDKDDYLDMVYINNRNLSRYQYLSNDKVFKLHYSQTVRYIFYYNLKLITNYKD